MELSEQDKQRIEKEANWRFTNGHGATDEYLAEVFMGACVYEHSHLSDLLVSQSKEIAELKRVLKVIFDESVKNRGLVSITTMDRGEIEALLK